MVISRTPLSCKPYFHAHPISSPYFLPQENVCADKHMREQHLDAVQWPTGLRLIFHEHLTSKFPPRA